MKPVVDEKGVDEPGINRCSHLNGLANWERV